MALKNSAVQLAIRWLARTISTLAAVFWLLILLDIIACDMLVGFVCVNWEMALLLGVALFSILSVVIAWRKEGMGGIVMLVWGLVFSAIAIITSTSQRVYSVCVSGLPFIVAGIMFLMSDWWQTYKRSNSNPLGTI
jgi:hypothetical protein